MRPDQRKPVEMLPRGLQRNSPSFRRVALFAIGPELRFVNISVAVGALRSGIRKDRAGMALHAGHILVHAQ